VKTPKLVPHKPDKMHIKNALKLLAITIYHTFTYNSIKFNARCAENPQMANNSKSDSEKS